MNKEHLPSTNLQKGAAPLLLLVGIVLVMGLVILLNFAPVKNQLLSSFFPKSQSQAFGTITDLTSSLEQLGNPAKARWLDTNTPCRYARNVWDLQNFNGKLYIGSGNSSNTAPCANAGPVTIVSYNPGSNQFNNEISLAQEQIDKFVILNNSLVVPGHDPKGPDGLFWYRLENGNWVTHTGPSIIHMYDMAFFNSTLFAAVGAAGPIIYTSNNDGATWASSNSILGTRSHTLFTIGGNLYSSMVIPATPIFNYFPITKYVSGTNFTTVNIQFDQLFPSTTIPSGELALIKRPTNYGASLVYIGAINVNDHQSDPFGLYKLNTISASSTDASKINLPGNAKPWDILNGSDGKVYVLGSIVNGSRYWVTVSSSSDLNNWTETFRFDAPSFARSFEQINGDWYFGLGTDTTALSINSGEIFKLKSTFLNPQPSPSSISGPINPSPPLKIGDTDGNGKVDIFDYNQLLTDYGKKNDATTRSDLDNDDDVDIFDYNILLSNFGK